MATWLAVQRSKAVFLLTERTVRKYKVMKNIALLRCTANKVGTGHKLHFQPKNPARAKLVAINNKNGCGPAEV